MLPTNPGLAPGYRYETSPAPEDGEYSITNNMGQWGFIYDTWIRIGDNSPSNDGYMMVVNASYDPGLFYEKKIEGLCENTTYEFSADVINVERRSVPNSHILPNVSFLIDGTITFETGNIYRDEQWHTYGFTFSTAPGQTSVTLALQNNAPGGIGNDLALDNISFRACGPLATVAPAGNIRVCDDTLSVNIFAELDGNNYGQAYFQWQVSRDSGQTWENIPGARGASYQHTALKSGDYYYRYLVAGSQDALDNPKCHVQSEPKVIQVVPKEYTIIDTICAGNSYLLGTFPIFQPGVYVDTLVSTLGCDSVVTLELAVVPREDPVAEVLAENMSCHDIQDGVIQILDLDGGTPPYTFEMTGILGEPDYYNSFLDSGVYELSIKDRYGCSFDTTLLIEAPAPFEIELGPDREITLGDTIHLNSQGNYSVAERSWTPSEGIFECLDTECLSTVVTLRGSDYVKLYAVNDQGCEASDSVYVLVGRQHIAFFPTGFTPNNDGVNDYFGGYGPTPQVDLIENLSVFNRWGQLVFSEEGMMPNDETAGWDGTQGGRPAPEGVYVYRAQVRFLDGVVRGFTGTVTIIR